MPKRYVVLARSGLYDEVYRAKSRREAARIASAMRNQRVQGGRREFLGVKVMPKGIPTRERVPSLSLSAIDMACHLGIEKRRRFCRANRKSLYG